MVKINDLASAISVLSWDSEVNLPSKSGNLRAQQQATLTTIYHQEMVDPKFGKLLKKLSKDPLQSVKKKNISLTLKDFSREKKLSDKFVKNKSLTISEAFLSWSNAREKSDFKLFEPQLNKIFKIVREEVDLVGYTHHPYNAMLDVYEPNMSVSNLDVIFDQVKNKVIPLIPQIIIKQDKDKSFLSKKYPKEKQWEFGLDLIKKIGFDLDRGRQDLSTHPFTISFGPSDVRLTTRIDEYDLGNMIWSCIHEAGHGMYEQGLPEDQYGLPSGSYASLGIHESQSRLWENNLGRSHSFWKYFFPLLKSKFKENLNGLSLNHFCKAINHIEPSKIRTEADELHYHLHVLVRYEIEKEIMCSKITARDAKHMWNNLYKKYLGIKIENDREGILQDVHWSHGSIGYFPTYSLGSFYAAQFYDKMSSLNPNLNSEIEVGNFKSVHQWLQNNVYKYGKTLHAEDLCKKATGEPLNLNPFVKYIKNKHNIS